jgi:hypothetical protein
MTGTGPRHGEFRGIYVTAFEASAFRECRGREYWWLSGELGRIFDVLPPEGPPAWSGSAYVHVRGTRSKRGRYGHAGGSPYELVVSEVLDVSADTLGACGR